MHGGTRLIVISKAILTQGMKLEITLKCNEIALHITKAVIIYIVVITVTFIILKLISNGYKETPFQNGRATVHRAERKY